MYAKLNNVFIGGPVVDFELTCTEQDVYQMAKIFGKSFAYADIYFSIARFGEDQFANSDKQITLRFCMPLPIYALMSTVLEHRLPAISSALNDVMVQYKRELREESAKPGLES